MLDLKSVTKRFGSETAIDGVSLEIPKSGVVALIGPSGCGKSTLLRLLIGLHSPDKGEVLLEGRPLADHGLPGVRTRFGYVIQDGGLFPHLTARGNARLPGRQTAAGRRVGGIDARITELAGLVHLTPDQLDRFPGELSGGQRQRVALVRALVLDPEILLLDEPLGALDPVIRAELQAELKDLFQRLNKTVVLVTHDLAEAAYLADDIVLMNQGRVAQRGSFRTLRTDPADDFVRRFVTEQVDRVRALIDGAVA